MAKRYTDAKKWSHPWFRNLPLKAKIVWLYLLDDCDHAGVWIVDYEIASMRVGFAFSEEDLIKWFDFKLYWLDRSRLFVRGFIEFQQGDRLNPANRCHRSILDILSKYSIHLDDPKMTLARPIDEPSKVLCNSNSNSNSNVRLDFVALYNKYPRKEGKSSGILRCEKLIKTQAEYDSLSKAIDSYSNHCAKTGQIIKHFDSFLGSDRTGHPWKDWADPNAGAISKPTSRIDLESQEFTRKLMAGEK